MGWNESLEKKVKIKTKIVAYGSRSKKRQIKKIAYVA